MAAIILGLPTIGSAQFLGQLTTAENLSRGNQLMGGYLGFYEDVTIAATFQYRYGFTNFLDGGLRLGIISVDVGDDDEAGVVFGGDIKYRILNAAAGDEFDLSFGTGLETAHTSDLHIYSLGGSIIGSVKLRSHSGRIITPYARLLFRAQNTHWDGLRNNHRGSSDSDFDLGFNIGSQLSLTQKTSIIMELQLEDDFFGLIAGINYLK